MRESASLLGMCEGAKCWKETRLRVASNRIGRPRRPVDLNKARELRSLG